MSSDDPPNNYFNGIGYNPSFYKKDSTGLTKTEGDTYYLSKQNSDISTAALTTFNGQVQTKGDTTFKKTIFQDTNNLIADTGLIYQLGSNMSYFNISPTLLQTYHKFYNRAAGSAVDNLKLDIGTDIQVTDGVLLNTRQIKSTTPASNAHQLFDNMTTAGVLTIGNALSTNQIKGVTTFGQAVTINSGNFQVTGGSCTASNYFGGGYNCNDGTLTFPLGLSVTSGSVTIGSTLTSGSVAIGTNNTTSTTNILNRMNFTGTSMYNFGTFTNTNSGYVSKTTGTSIATPTFVTNTNTVMATSPSIPVGVWRVDYAVQTTVNTGGTITSSQAYVATSALPTTQLLLTGSLVRSHISEVYATGDVQVITSSFTLQVSTAATYVVTILKTFTTGQYTFTGEVSFTRLA